MKFSDNETEFEFNDALHPVSRELAMAVDSWCIRRGYGERTITDVGRNPAWYKEHKLEPNPHSWHIYLTAFDLRSNDLQPGEAALIAAHIRELCQPREKWELIFENHGTGPHWHIAYRDNQWKATFQNKEQPHND